MSNINNQSKSHIKSIRRFFWWTAGASAPVLENCPTEQMKYTAIGVMMFFIALLSCASFSFFISYTFEMPAFFALLAGLVWAALILCLERLILTSFRKGEISRLSIALRFALVISTALVIGEPLLLQLFRKEINLEMLRRGHSVVTTARQEITARYQDEVNNLEKAGNEIQSRLDTLKADRDEKEKAVIGEVEGSGGTGKKGEGTVAKRKDVAFKEADAKYNDFKTESAETLKQNNARLAEIRLEIENQTKLTGDADRGADGILSRHEALFSIIRNNAGAALVYIPLFSILLLIETLPLTIKVFGKKGVYDTALESEEARQIVEIEEQNEFEKENLVRSRRLQKTLAEKFLAIIVNDNIGSLSDENDIRVVNLLKAEVLRMIENEVFQRQSKLLADTDFAEAITVEVIGHHDLQISLQVPDNSQKTLSLKTISGDIQRIADTIGEKLQLIKAFSSAKREISASLPLLSQLEKDRKILLQFNESAGET